MVRMGDEDEDEDDEVGPARITICTVFTPMQDIRYNANASGVQSTLYAHHHEWKM